MGCGASGEAPAAPPCADAAVGPDGPAETPPPASQDVDSPHNATPHPPVDRADTAGKSAPTSTPDDSGADDDDWSWRRVVLDRYEVKGSDVLGVGNFSIVRRGVDQRSGQAVAVKSLLRPTDDRKFRREVFLFNSILSNRGAGGGEERQQHDRFYRSPSVWAALNGGGGTPAAQPEASTQPEHDPQHLFVQLLDHSTLSGGGRIGQCYRVLELGDFTLQELITHCQEAHAAGAAHALATGDQIARVSLHLLRGLAFLHGHLLIHGDLKPANIMWFGTSRTWKLIDLDGLLTSSALVDMRDADFYTPIYAAPELAAAVAAGGPLRVSRSLDMWAAGAIVAEMDALAPVLWPQFEEFCNAAAEAAAGDQGAGESDDGRGDGSSSGSSSSSGGLLQFMHWLSKAQDPFGVAGGGGSTPRAAPTELMALVRDTMLATDAARRGPPAAALDTPLLRAVAARERELPAPSLRPPTPPAAPDARPTEFAQFKQTHRGALEARGLKGGALNKEIARMWKAHKQGDGGELQGARGDGA